MRGKATTWAVEDGLYVSTGNDIGSDSLKSDQFGL
jgi:hypothetical protein